MNIRPFTRFLPHVAMLLLVSLSVLAPAALLRAQDHVMPDGAVMHGDMSMPMDHSAEMTPAERAKLLADKTESEGNHHIAGALVILAAIFMLAEPSLRRRWPGVRFAWPLCFFAAGIFLLVYSDTELWPFGPQTWWYGFTHNSEIVQHKTFAAILLGLGVLEIQRARGIVKAAWTGFVFPVLATAGSILLLFHEHHTGKHGPGHMAIMQHIQSEHLSFAATGVGIGLFAGLSEFPTRLKSTFARLFPTMMIALGILLLLYTE